MTLTWKRRSICAEITAATPRMTMSNAVSITRLGAALLIASLGLFLSVVSTSNAQQGPALISGEVVNGTPGGELHAERLVVLHILMQDGNQDFRSAATDANGAFSFPDVPTSDVLGYLLVATHLGVDYTLEILPGEPLTDLELEIFETTTDIESIGIVLDSVMIADWDVTRRTLSVLELVQLENNGSQTFVPDLSQPASMSFLRFALPSDARDLQVQTQLPEGQVLQVDRGFAITTAVPPGQHGMAFTYTTPYQGDRVDFSKRFSLGAQAFRLLIPVDLGSAINSALRSGNDVQIGDTDFRVLQAEDVPPGGTVDVVLENLPQPSLLSTAISSLSESTAVWVAPIALVLGLSGLIVIGIVRRRGARSVAEDSVAQEVPTRDELIQAIVDLDNRLERNEVTEQEHEHQRQILKAKLLEQDMSAREALEK